MTEAARLGLYCKSVSQGKEAVRLVLQYNYCIVGWKGHEAG